MTNKWVNVIVNEREGAYPQGKMNKIVTINDIAEAAGVGKGTVDRVLHNRGRVSEETREKVLRCIKELGYKPNVAARMLAKRNVYRIAVVYHNTERDFWEQVESGISRAEEEYRQMGIVVDRYIISKISIEKQLEFIEHAIREKYDGLAIVPYSSASISDALNRAVSQGMKVVTFNNDEACRRLCYVGQDSLQSGRTAGRLMGMIAPPNSRYVVITPVIEGMKGIDQRYEGFKEILNVCRPDMELHGVYNCRQDGKQAYERTLELLDEGSVDAIYVSNVVVSEVARAVFDRGVQHRIKLEGHDLTDTIKDYISNDTIDITIGQEPEIQGYIAVERICKALLQDEEIKTDYYTKIEVVIKENLAYR